MITEESDLERANRELSTLRQLSASLIQSINVDQFLQHLIESAGRILAVKSGAIVMPDPDGYLRIKASFGLRPENVAEYVISPGEGQAGRIFRNRKAAIFVTSEAKSTFHKIIMQEQIVYSMGAPMISNSADVLGVVFLNDKLNGDSFNDRDLEILVNFANLAALGVEKQRQLEELDRRKASDRALAERLEASLSELQAVNERLKESNQLKDEVLSICAHDIRSPLTSIISYAQLLLASSDLSERHRKYVEQINRSSEKINSIVDNLLVRARYLETNEPLRLESVSLSNLLREAIEQVEDRLTAKNIQVSLDDRWRGRVRADRFKLGQVFDNLLDNASKFTPDGAEIKIIIEIDSSNDNSVRVKISNPGEGISREDIPRLFMRYFKSSTAQNRTGYGLGLAICRQNIELHGGRIEAESIPDVETSFTVYIPIGKNSILLVSSDLNICERLGIASTEHNINQAADSDGLLELITREIPTAIIIDVDHTDAKLPSALNQIRRELGSERVKILLTNSSHPDLSSEAIAPIVLPENITHAVLSEVLTS